MTWRGMGHREKLVFGICAGLFQEFREARRLCPWKPALKNIQQPKIGLWTVLQPESTILLTWAADSIHCIASLNELKGLQQNPRSSLSQGRHETITRDYQSAAFVANMQKHKMAGAWKTQWEQDIGRLAQSDFLKANKLTP